MWGVLRLGHDTPLIAVAQAIVVEFFESCRKAIFKLFSLIIGYGEPGA
jgi:hypothetical protein